MSELSGKIKGVIVRYKVLVGGLLTVAILLLAMLVYAGMWPPVYVVESASMQHSDTESALGTIDTGDLVLVRSSDDVSVRTYVDCFLEGDRSFGDFGDVIIYERYGREEYTPVIHRAMLRLEFNESSGSFDLPSLARLPSAKWGNGGLEEGRWWNLTGSVEIYDVGYRSALLHVDLSSLLKYAHDGLITMGDHNVVRSDGQWLGVYDQSAATICLEPVMDGWVIGVAKAEIPWIGLINLWVNGNMPANTPENSKAGLVAVIVLVIAVPLALDLTGMFLERRGIDPWAWLRGRLRRK
ncbi:MAG: S26 family signal peptidase [Euryarchaeota archaeon]|nr:S26 family signal peptidase [Euryarchaeota archaeon]